MLSPVTPAYADLYVWPDNTWRYRGEFSYAECAVLGDDYIVLETSTPRWVRFYNERIA